MHTQGDAAITDVVTIFDELDKELDFSKSRHRLEHCLMLPKSELLRIKILNLFPIFHMNHLYYYGEALNNDLLGAKRTAEILPIKSALDQHIISTLHADQPMFESKTKQGTLINESERLKISEAIKSLTLNAAYQIHKESKIDSLEKGKYADFVILNENPYLVKPENLHKIRCIQTFINGNKVSH